MHKIHLIQAKLSILYNQNPENLYSVSISIDGFTIYKVSMVNGVAVKISIFETTEIEEIIDYLRELER